MHCVMNACMLTSEKFAYWQGLLDVINALEDGTCKSVLQLLESAYSDIDKRLTRAQTKQNQAVRFSILEQDNGPKSTVKACFCRALSQPRIIPPLILLHMLPMYVLFVISGFESATMWAVSDSMRMANAYRSDFFWVKVTPNV
jgi:hypothetical protein